MRITDTDEVAGGILIVALIVLGAATIGSALYALTWLMMAAIP